MFSMRVATWNVYKGNRKIKSGLHHLFSNSPDIVCLQEVPYETLSLLRREFPEYSLYYTFDFVNSRLEGSIFICLLTKLPVVGGGEYVYSEKIYHSPLSDILYKKIETNKEQHMAVYLDVLYKGEKIRFQGVRLSCAVGPSIRRGFIRSLQKNFISSGQNVILGDLNVSTDKILGLLEGQRQ